MKKYDTVIVGAGPGGLRCAAVLARHGQRVLVLERKKTIGPKVCAGGIPFNAVCELGIPPALLEQTFPAQYIKTPWQKVTLRAATPVIATISRSKLGQWMLREAIAAGAEIAAGEAVTEILATHVRTKSRRAAYSFLVGADGSSSMVRRFLQIPTWRLGTGINFQAPIARREMEWHLNPHTFQSGYAWVFPHQESSSIGAYADRQDVPPAQLLRKLYHWSHAQDLTLHQTKPQAALINFDFRGWHFRNIFLVGDAAGLASGFTGEGIYPAIVAGETAAHTILNPNYAPAKLNRIIQQQKRHSRMQKFFTGNKVICQIGMEMLVLALKLRLIGFETLEMH